MGVIKSLAADTIVYGASTILGRLLNWLLMPLYVRTIASAEYGLSVNIYAIIAILLVVFSLGFETGYFRFVTRENKDTVYCTLSRTVLGFSLVVSLLMALVGAWLCPLLEIPIDRQGILWLLCAIVTVDAYNSIYFAELRYDKRGVKYSLLRLLQVLVTVLLNLFFILYLRKQTMSFFDFTAIGDVEYILLGNLIGSASTLAFFVPQNIMRSKEFSPALLKTVLAYCLPLVGMGFFGMANQNIEKILIVKLDYHDDTLSQLALYGANYKIGILMAIFTQSFRLAFEPFFFKRHKDSHGDDRSVYAQTMKYFIYFGLLIFVGVVAFLPLLNLILTDYYTQGNVVIPFVLLGQLLFGIYYNLSIWYKVTDKTYFGIVFSVAGLAVNTAVNFALIPTLGIIGAAIGTLVGYSVMMTLSACFGNRHYAIPYQWWRYLLAAVLAAFCAFGTRALSDAFGVWPVFACLAVAVFVGYVYLMERLEKSK